MDPYRVYKLDSDEDFLCKQLQISLEKRQEMKKKREAEREEIQRKLEEVKKVKMGLKNILRFGISQMIVLRKNTTEHKRNILEWCEEMKKSKNNSKNT